VVAGAEVNLLLFDLDGEIAIGERTSGQSGRSVV
jgi:hypothetical protein